MDFATANLRIPPKSESVCTETQMYTPSSHNSGDGFLNALKIVNRDFATPGNGGRQTESMQHASEVLNSLSASSFEPLDPSQWLENQTDSATTMTNLCFEAESMYTQPTKCLYYYGKNNLEIRESHANAEVNTLSTAGLTDDQPTSIWTQ